MAAAKSTREFWRLLGQCPQYWRREQLQSISIDGWNPWEASWTRLMEPAIVLPDPLNGLRQCHIDTYKVIRNSHHMRFAAHIFSDDVWRFWLPSEPQTPGASYVTRARYEGHWRAADNDQPSSLPWPKPEPSWDGRTMFVKKLADVEKEAERISYRGFSYCRICGTQNGSAAYRLAEWEWPAGYMHYIIVHDVRPTAEFEQFIASCARSGNRSE